MSAKIENLAIDVEHIRLPPGALSQRLVFVEQDGNTHDVEITCLKVRGTLRMDGERTSLHGRLELRPKTTRKAWAADGYHMVTDVRQADGIYFADVVDDQTDKAYVEAYVDGNHVGNLVWDGDAWVYGGRLAKRVNTNKGQCIAMRLPVAVGVVATALAETWAPKAAPDTAH